MAEQFSRNPMVFGDGGIHLNSPVDLCPEDRYPFCVNIYSAQAGSVQPRPGYTHLSASGQGGINQIKRINNALPGAQNSFQRFTSSKGGSINAGKNGEIPLDSGYSGLPVSMVISEPAQTPESWLYAADSLKMRKFRTDAQTVENVGIFPPTVPPVVGLDLPNDVWIAKWESSAAVSAGGIAGSPATVSRVPVSTILSAIVYDFAAPGWASVAVSNPSNSYSFLGRLSHLTFGSEVAIVQQVFAQRPTTSVAGIHYDSDSHGPCTIQLTLATAAILPDQLLELNSSEYVRVLSVTSGPDGLASFRCKTVGTISVGNTVLIPPSIRVALNGTHAAGEAIAEDVTQSTLTLAGGTTQGTGTLTYTTSVDVSQSGGRPLTEDDYMHISVLVDHPELVLYGRVLLDVDEATNDFTHNFYYQPFEANDFTGASQGTEKQTDAQQLALGLQQVRTYDATSFYEKGVLSDAKANLAVNPYADYPITTSMQAITGNSVWTEFVWKISDLQRVGSDATRTLANVQAVRLELTVVGTVQVQVASLTAGGTYGPDVFDSTYGVQGFPIILRYRYRSSQTGAISVPSPALRSGLLPRRQLVICTATQSPDPQVDFIDWEAFGGSQNVWNYVGSAPNAPSNFLKYDLDNTAKLANDPFSVVAFQPVPVSDSPKHMQVSTVGTAVTLLSGDSFDGRWAAGATLLIGGRGYTLYAPPNGATDLQTVENVGVNASVAMVIAEPTIMGQPVPIVWGPDKQGRYFFAGDPYNPGRVYPSNSDQDGGLDGVSDQTYIEVSSASDPVMNGVVMEDSAIVLTANTLQRLQPSYGEKTIVYTPSNLETGRGLYARYGLVVYGGVLYYIANDGIYAWTPGSESKNITEERLGPLFPHGSVPGIPVSRGFFINPPDYSKPDELRLGSINGFVVFSYPDTTGTRFSLAYEVSSGAWWLWYHAAGAVCLYQEEGKSINTSLIGLETGELGVLSGVGGDAGAPISCALFTRAVNAGDPRSTKTFGDAWIKANTAGAIVSARACTEDYSTLTDVTLSPVDSQSIFLDLRPIGEVRNLGLGFTWSTTSPDAATQVFYNWEIASWELHPQMIDNWKSQVTTHGLNGYQHVQELWIAYRANAPFTWTIIADQVTYSYTVPSSNGVAVKRRIQTAPIKGKMFIYGSSGAPVSLYFADIEVKVKQWGSTEAFQSIRPFVN